ncbi:tryptophan synthase subunit alpha [Streptomyces sp. ST2-7A]|uniref:tryptophan synthase subunit alpha n=1 Tax=Streptomyces sp. ST2-7A TaxID=2907214 RepID=UPI001F2E5D0A|nr:tryptophan synthase subunit alpha [Streptomyces sp. ST2-7A]MCE7081105.1 tryptophan synthase subunit alpha [Streptomyces sp. ST2-7A]
MAEPATPPTTRSRPSPFFAGLDGEGGHDRPGLAVFLNAGDPPLSTFGELTAMLDELGVECLELAVPFPDSITDGPAVRRSAARALAAGTGLDAVLAAVAEARPRLRRLRIALLADWAHTVRPLGREGPARLARDTVAVGADGILLHGLPPRLRAEHLRTAGRAGLPVVTTAYARSSAEVLRAAAEDATAYVYLVAVRGRSGNRPTGGYQRLAPVVSGLKKTATAPVAVGFGVRTHADLVAVARLGADAAVVGTAAVTAVEGALDDGGDPVAALAGFLTGLRGDG